MFHFRLAELLDDVTKQGILGQVAAHVYVIEFQKRGLPHAHILLWFQDGWRMHTPEQYDTIIRAEIPDTNLEPELHDLVVQHMLHNRCDTACPSNRAAWPCCNNTTGR